GAPAAPPFTGSVPVFAGPALAGLDASRSLTLGAPQCPGERRRHDAPSHRDDSRRRRAAQRRAHRPWARRGHGCAVRGPGHVDAPHLARSGGERRAGGTAGDFQGGPRRGLRGGAPAGGVALTAGSRMFTMAPRMEITPHTAIGVSLALLGVVLTLDNLGFVEGDAVMRFWQLC